MECERRRPILLDVEDFLEPLKATDKGNYVRNLNKVLSEFPTEYFNQHERVEEIFSKIIDI